MAKSRRNVSGKKRQHKRRNSRRNFRKMSGGTDISEEDKTFLLIVEWKVPKSDDKYSSIQERLGNKSITWGSKETINSIISNSSAIYENGKQKFCIKDIEHLKNFARDNKINNDKFYYTSIQIIKWLGEGVGPSTHAYSAPNSAPNSA